MLSESVFKFGKGTRVLTEPLLAWITGTPGQSLLVSTEGGKCLHGVTVAELILDRAF